MGIHSRSELHTALRARPWAFTHHTHRQHLRALLTRGIGILALLALAPRRDQRVGGRRTPWTHASVDPPPTLLDELAYRAERHLVGYEQQLLVREVHSAL